MLLLAFGSFCSTAQVVSSTPFPGTQYGQMLVTGKTYTGTYLDTLTNNGTLYLTTCQGSNGALTLGPVANEGIMEIRVKETKISGGPYGTWRLESSLDGVTWGNEANYNNVADTVLMDSASATRVKTWYFTGYCAPYYRVNVTVPSGITQKSSYIAQYFVRRRQTMQVTK